MQDFSVHTKSNDTNAGTLTFQQARVMVFEYNRKIYLNLLRKKDSTFRTLSIEVEIEFNRVLDLHTIGYQKIIEGRDMDY